MASERMTRDKTRQPSSNYDFIKVKVWLGPARDHYYVLSRFLISRMLTVTKLPPLKAVEIALELKKLLVDTGCLELLQCELEELLFELMRARGFGDAFVARYQMVTAFHLQRRPLIVFICGTACTGKSTLAQQLAARLNLPNVLQTDVIYELLQTAGLTSLAPQPLWDRSDLTPEQLQSEFQAECRIVRQGINGDLTKCVRDGKSFIIEGLHLDPGLYLYEFGRHGMSHLKPPQVDTPASEGAGPRVWLPAPDTQAAAPEPEQPLLGQDSQRRGDRAAVDRYGGADEQQHSPPHEAWTPLDAAPSLESDGSGKLGSSKPSEGHRNPVTVLKEHLNIRSRLRRSKPPDETASPQPPAQPSPSEQRPSRRSAFAGRVMFALRPSRARSVEASGPPAVGRAISPVLVESSKALASFSSPSLAEFERAQPQRASATRCSQSTQTDVPPADDGIRAGSAHVPLPDSKGPAELSSAARESSRLEPRRKSVRFSDAGDAEAPGHQQEGRHEGKAESEQALGPVFVPIVLTMDPAEHGTLLEDWCQHQPACGQQGPGTPPSDRVPAVMERLMVLQRYLSGYETYDVPVLQVSVTDFQETLDQLHDYLLQCMALAMAS